MQSVNKVYRKRTVVYFFIVKKCNTVKEAHYAKYSTKYTVPNASQCKKYCVQNTAQSKKCSALKTTAYNKCIVRNALY